MSGSRPPAEPGGGYTMKNEEMFGSQVGYLKTRVARHVE